MILTWLRETSAKNIIPLAMLRSRLSTLSTYWMSLSYCAGHRMGHWSYRGFMRWCTPDGSASGWVEGLQARWGVRKLDASWFQGIYNFWGTHEVATLQHIATYIVPVPHQVVTFHFFTFSSFILSRKIWVAIVLAIRGRSTIGRIHSFLSKCWSSYLPPPFPSSPAIISSLPFPLECLLSALCITTRHKSPQILPIESFYRI